MSKKTTHLKVMDVPSNISEDKLRTVFSNKRRQGGGPVERIRLHRATKTALITFASSDAVDLIMSRGPNVEIDGQIVSVKPCIVKSSASGKKASPPSQPDQKVSTTSDKAEICETSEKVPDQLQRTIRATVSDVTRHKDLYKTEICETSEKVPDRVQTTIRPTVSDVTRHKDLYKAEICETSEKVPDRLQRTIRATVSDVTRHKDIYVLYLNDKSINDGEFEEDTIMLDGLHGYVFVTFLNAKDARSFCRLHHRKDSNILKVEMATVEDLNIYPNLLSLYVQGLNLEENFEKLKEFIEEKTGIEIIKAVCYDEPRSMIVEFSQKMGKETIETLTWLCSEEFFQTEPLITAPVHKNNMLLVTGLHPKTEEYMLKRYLSNKYCDDNENISVEWQGRNALVTMRLEQHVEAILNEKTHRLEGRNLCISHYHPCLTAETYAQYFENPQMPHSASREVLSVSHPSPRTSKNSLKKASIHQQESRNLEKTISNDDEDDEEGDTEEKSDVECANKEINVLQEKVDLKKHELYLLQEINFLEHLEKAGNIKVTISHDEGALILEGTDTSCVHNAAIRILEETNTIQSKHIKSFVPAQVEVLSREYAQQKIMDKWRKKSISAYFKCENEKITLFYFPTVDVEAITNVMASQVVMKQKRMNENMLKIFSSHKGKSFISELNAAMNDSWICGYVELDIMTKNVVYVGPYKVLDQLTRKVKDFMENCTFLEKRIEFPEMKKHFVEQFLKSKMEQIIQSLYDEGITVEFHEDALVLSGPAESIQQGEEQLTILSERITSKNCMLNFVGITKFLLCSDGKKLVEEIENKHSCVISCDSKSEVNEASGGINSIASSPRFHQSNQATTIATMTVGGCSIYFVQGDILSIDTDVIVNTLDASYTCRDSLGKAIISKGGEGIQRELKGSRENVILTSSGRLPNCQAIIHIVCPKTSVEIEDLKSSILKCLKVTSRKQFRSIAFPTVSTGRFFKVPDVAFAKLLMEVFKTHLDNEEEDTSLTRIILCDFKVDNIKLVIERCQNTFKGNHLNSVGEYHEAPHVKHRHQKHGASPGVQHFGNISVHIISGEITKEKSDIIVTTVDRSLNLEKGKISQAVLKYGGQTIQTELSIKYSQGISPGQTAVTSGGNLKCSSIIHTCLSNYNGEDATHISKAVKEVLKKADSLKVSSISIPALGTGGLKYPADISAQAIVASIKEFAKFHKKTTLKRINIVIHPKATDVMQTFEAAMATGEEESDIAAGIQQESSVTFNFGSVKLTVKQGDLTEERCNAVVISLRENLNFMMSGAVAKSVLKKCGSEVLEECQSQAEVFASTGLMTTSGGKLFADCIMYVSMDKYGKSWSTGLIRALMKAEHDGIKSLAFAAVGAGKKSADVDSIREMVFNVVKKFGTGERRNLTDIRLVIFTRELMDAFISQGGSQMDSSDRASAHRQSPATSSTLSDSAKVTIYSLNDSNCNAAGEALTNACKIKYIDKKDKESIARMLSGKQIKELQELGLRCNLQVDVDVRESSISIQGFPLKDGQLTILQKLREFDKAIAETQRKEHEEIPLAFQWQFKSSSKWRSFKPNSNAQLEIAYNRKLSYLDLTDETGHKYHIDFKTMKEYYVDSSRGRSLDGIDIQRVDRTREEPLPKRWDCMNKDGNLKMVVLRADSQEYRKVAKYFKDKGVTDAIKKIERVQNKTLFQQYAVKKREIDARNPPDHENEKRLYHGTDSSSVDAICQNGFNRNYSGVNATMYGTGVYFAVESSYSVTFSPADSNNNRKMFQARVLVGESVSSSSETRYLPMKPKSKHPYDSGVNSVSNPDIYVIFHDAQAYPEYLITF